MKKNVRTLIACAAVLAVAGGGYAAMLMLDDDGNDTSSSVSSSAELIAATPETILSFEKADIKSIVVSNANGGYESVPTGKSSEDAIPVFTIKGIEDLEINTMAVSSLLNSSSALSCDKVVAESADDLEKFGLADPQAKVTVKTASDSKTLLVGNESPESGETYCMIDGENRVCLAATSSLNVFTNSKENFVSTTIIPSGSDDEKPSPQKITISRKDLDYDIILEPYKNVSGSGNQSGTMATHIMTEPVFSYLDVEKIQDVTQGFFGLSAFSVISAHPDDVYIKASNLDDPFCTVDMSTADGEKYTLKIGRQLEDVNDGTYYAVMVNDVDVIYAVSAESLCWAKITPGDITSKMVFGTYVWDIAKLDIDVNGGESVRFTGSGTDAESYQVSKNGEKCDTQRFRDFYTFLLKTSAEEFVIDEQPQGQPDVTVNLETQDGKTKQTVEFYKSDGKKSLIVVNGTPSFKCRTAYVELLIKNLTIFDTKDEFVMNW